jgi:hypothetical protein
MEIDEEVAAYSAVEVPVDVAEYAVEDFLVNVVE